MNENLEKLIHELAKELQKNSKLLDSQSKYKDRTAHEIKNLLTGLNFKDLNKDIGDILDHIESSELLKSKKSDLLGMGTALKNFKSELTKVLIQSNPATAILHKFGAFDKLIKTGESRDKKLESLLNAVKGRTNTSSAPINNGYLGNNLNPNAVHTFKVQNAMIQANNVAILVNSAKGAQGTSPLLPMAGNKLQDKIIETKDKKQLLEDSTKKGGQSQGLTTLTKNIGNLGKIVAPVVTTAGKVVAIQAILWALLGIANKIWGNSPNKPNQPNKNGKDPNATPSDDNQTGKFNPGKLSRSEAIKKVKLDKDYEDLSKGGKNWKIAPGAMVNDIPFARAGVGKLLDATGIKGLEITGAMGTKNSPHAGKGTGKGHYSGTKLDISTRGKSRKEIESLANQLMQSGIFSEVLVENDHIDVQFKKSSLSPFAKSTDARIVTPKKLQVEDKTKIQPNSMQDAVNRARFGYNEVNKTDTKIALNSQQINLQKRTNDASKQKANHQQLVALASSPKATVKKDSTNMIFGINERVQYLYATEDTVTV